MRRSEKLRARRRSFGLDVAPLSFDTCVMLAKKARFERLYARRVGLDPILPSYYRLEALRAARGFEQSLREEADRLLAGGAP